MAGNSSVVVAGTVVVVGMRGHLLALVDRDVPAQNLPPEDRNPEPCSIPGLSRFRPGFLRLGPIPTQQAYFLTPGPPI